jgi:small-conductance mechanosensitive channel
MGSSTMIKTNDGVLVHVPNRDMNIMAVTNMSLNDIIRVTVRVPHQQKCRYIQIDIRSKDAIYSTQAYASKANQGMDQ